MKVLVTGGAGFIGSHVVDGLIKGGHKVVVVDNLSTGFLDNIHPDASFYQIDIRDPGLAGVFEKEKPDIVNHHAAQISVRVSLQDPPQDAQINVLGSLNVIECCKNYGVKKVIYISTGGAVYGEPKYLPCDENHPIDPLCPYGVTKHTVEHYLFLYNRLFGLKYTVLRYPNVYGPRQDPYGEAGVVAIFTRQMLKDQQAVINGTGDQERDFVYVADVVRANILAMKNGACGIFNVGWGRGASVNQIFQTLASITGYTRKPVHQEAIPGEVFKICLDATKARKELGWIPQTDLEDGMRYTVEYFKAKQDQG
ncbi:MAG: NAD-dependent epimerase/dehydratase family protein [Dehalococcoidia bacterium]|nr:NAD-dependent epimerase/dehydratase family protein [Dehalococcoidia bacterium]